MNLKKSVKIEEFNFNHYVRVSENGNKEIVLYDKKRKQIKTNSISKLLQTNLKSYFSKFNSDISSILYKFNNDGTIDSVTFIFYCEEKRCDLCLIYTSNIEYYFKDKNGLLDVKCLENDWYYYLILYT